MIGEFDVPFVLITQFGNLPINQALDTTTDRRFQLTADRCRGYLPVRETDADDVPQGDGAISHRRWRPGYQVHLAIEPVLWHDADHVEPACGSDLVDMLDTLGLFVNELIRTGQVGGAGARLSWSPSGQTDRMIDRLQLKAISPPSPDGELGGIVVEMDLDSAFPYFIEAAETDTTILDGATETINNPGNTDYFPVFEIYGAYTDFTLTNHSVQDLDGVDLQVVYDASLPGAAAVVGGDWVEFEFFRETAYRNGNLSNRKGSIDWRVSDMFPLVPGDNDIEIAFTGEDGYTMAVCKSNGAWA